MVRRMRSSTLSSKISSKATGLKSMFGYDDSLDVFGVHGVGGIIGAIGTGFLASTSFGGGGYAEGVTMGGQPLRRPTLRS